MACLGSPNKQGKMQALSLSPYHSSHGSEPGTCRTAVLLSGCTGSARGGGKETISPAGTLGKPRCRARPGCAPISPTLPKPYLVGSKLYSCLPFHQRCTDLHDHRLDGVGTTPALRDETQSETRPTQLCSQCNQRAFPSSGRQWKGRRCQGCGVW